MKIFVIWIDREHAKVFAFSRDSMERQQFHAHRNDHHTHLRDGIAHQREENTLFSDVTKHIQAATNLLVIGPGVAKHHFQNYLCEHYPALARKITACKTVDYLTDGEIAALARDIFLVPKGQYK